MTLHLARKPQLGALVIGHHDNPMYAIDPLLAPKAMPVDLLDAIVDMGHTWRELVIDLYTLDFKKVMEASLTLVKLRVMLSEEFRSLVSARAVRLLCGYNAHDGP